RQFVARIAALAPEDLDRFAAVGLERYHLESHRIDHPSAWPRHVRLLPDDGIAFVQGSSMLRRLAATFGGVEITNEVEGGAPEIVWRLVRPGESGDAAPLHADAWFWEINGWPMPPGRRCIKVWTMLCGETGRAGLRVVPGSHRAGGWEYEVEPRHGMDKPVFDERQAGLEPRPLETPPGTSTVFSYRLLHGGAVTRDEVCRVSLEFTIFVPTG
ncbi:MAG: phytanoyl-CoA dioxygenase family protein, partial [Chloroflexi bacterium]|nr:phytanoyl-CoA dioxygenase family protein [Chloroflexota bacterium]